MKLGNQIMQNKWVRLETLKPSPQLREFIKASGAVEAMWEWLPRLPGRGTTYDAYFDHVMAQMKAGAMLPMFGHSKTDGAFVGGASFMEMSRTHRNARIGFMWTPPNLRGSPMTLAMQAAMLTSAVAWRAKRVYWMVDVLNTRQTAFVEKKISARREGVLESVARMNDGRWADIAIYALVGDRLEEAVERIEASLEREFAGAD